MNEQMNQRMKGWANEQVAIDTLFLWIKTEQKWKQEKKPDEFVTGCNDKLCNKDLTHG